MQTVQTIIIVLLLDYSNYSGPKITLKNFLFEFIIKYRFTIILTTISALIILIIILIWQNNWFKKSNK